MTILSQNGAPKNVPRVCGAQGNNTDCSCSRHVYGDVSESRRQFSIEEEYIITEKVYKILMEAKKGGQCGRLWNPCPGLSLNGFLIPRFMDPQWLLHYTQSLTTTAVPGAIWPSVTTPITKICRSGTPRGVARNTSLLHKWEPLNFRKLVCYSSFKNVVINEPCRFRMGQPTHLLQLKHVMH